MAKNGANCMPLSLNENSDNSSSQLTESSTCPICEGNNIICLHERVFQGKCWSLAYCQRCGQHFTLPEPSAKEAADFYGGEYHAEIRHRGGSEEIFGSKFRRYIKWIKGFVPPGTPCLDVGCATGLFPKLLSDEGYDASGIEINEESALWGRQHYGVRISVSTLENLEIPSTRYELLIFTDVLEHTLNPLRTLERAKHLLANKGYILVTFPDITSLESRYYRLLSKLFHKQWLWVTCHIPFHIWEFTPKTAVSLFAKAGLEVAAFRRSYHPIDLDGKFRVLSFFPRLLSIAPGRFGTQMEFMLRRQD